MSTEVASSHLKLCAGLKIDDRSRDVKIPGIVFAAVTIPIVLLRCYSRHNIAGRLWWDDWMICIAAVYLSH